MIALAPPVVEQCVAASAPAAKMAKAIWEVVGPPDVIAELLRSTKPGDWADVVVDEANGERRHVVLRSKSAASYRKVGGFIYRAEQARVTFTSRFYPPICGMDHN